MNRQPYTLTRSPYAGITTPQLWAVYNLMRGGISEIAKLAKLSGASRKALIAADTEKLFLWADNHWHHRKTLNDFTSPLKHRIRCKRCDVELKAVPCLKCECRGAGPDWVSPAEIVKRCHGIGERHSRAYQAIQQSERTYHGDGYEI